MRGKEAGEFEEFIFVTVSYQWTTSILEREYIEQSG